MEILGQMGCVLFATKNIFSDSKIVVESAQWVRAWGVVGGFFLSFEIKYTEDYKEY